MPPRLYLRRPQHLVLASIGRFRYLSSFQLDRLLYGRSLSHVQSAVSLLVKEEYIDWIPLPNYQLGGRNRQIYYLKKKGINYLRGFELPCRISRDKPTYQTLKHSLAINDLLIGAHRITGYDLAEFKTEFEMKSSPIQGLAPDGALLFTRESEVYPVILEVDRSTEQRKFFKDKIRKLARYTQGDYRHHLNHNSLTIAIVEVTDNPKRLADLLRWTEQELTALGAQTLGQTFLFASFDTDQEQLGRLFCEALWHTPFSEEPTALLS